MRAFLRHDRVTARSNRQPKSISTVRERISRWAHNVNTDRSVTPTFQTLPGATFVVNGAAQAHD